MKNIRSVICLGNTWTARRYPMTLHRHWPEVEKMLVMVDSFATPRALWHTDAEFSRRMLTEWDKIEPYKARGFIAEWPVERNARSIALFGRIEIFLRGQHSRQRTQAGSSCSVEGAPSASRTALGAWPGVTAKVVEGVNAMSRRAAAATNVCERQCGGSVSQR